jgi:VWFA-related protein
MSKLVRAGLLFAAGTAWLALARPVDQGDAPLPPAAPVVKLNVVAVDARGQAVPDLTREDFQVFDSGKLQHIASFRRNDVKPLRAAPPESNESSNRSGAPLSRATVILFDLLNARFDDRGYASSALVPALQHVEDSDSLFLYILTMDGALYAVHPLPSPEGAARTTAKPWTGDIKPLLDEAARKLFVLRPTDLDVDSRVRMTYRALGMLASKVAVTPGRKSIIWISHGVPISIASRNGDFDQIDYTPLLQRLTATLDRANVAVYTLRLPGSLAQANSPDGGLAGSRGPAPAGSLGAGLASAETLDEFAGLTGGRAYGTVDIERAITQAANDARMSYLIAYDPPLDKWDGKYHKIRVVCSRKGVRLQTKQGYYAFAGDAHQGDQETAALETMASSPFDIPEIGIYGRLMPTGKTPGEVNLEARIDAADVQLTREGDLYAGQLAVGAAAYHADGRGELGARSTLSLRLSPEQHEQAMKDGFFFARVATLQPTVRKLRVMVYDRASGAIGSLTLKVPDTTAKP